MGTETSKQNMNANKLLLQIRSHLQLLDKSKLKYSFQHIRFVIAENSRPPLWKMNTLYNEQIFSFEALYENVVMNS